MNNIFLPMFVVGLAWNRRLYDAGAYALAQPFEALQRHMTWSAFALGVAQLPFVAVARALPHPRATRTHLRHARLDASWRASSHPPAPTHTYPPSSCPPGS